MGRLGSILPYHPEVQCLKMNDNNIDDKCMQYIIDGLENNFIRTLEQERNNEPFRDITMLDFSNNFLTDDSFFKIIQILPEYCPNIEM